MLAARRVSGISIKANCGRHSIKGGLPDDLDCADGALPQRPHRCACSGRQATVSVRWEKTDGPLARAPASRPGVPREAGLRIQPPTPP